MAKPVQKAEAEPPAQTSESPAQAAEPAPRGPDLVAVDEPPGHAKVTSDMSEPAAAADGKTAAGSKPAGGAHRDGTPRATTSHAWRDLHPARIWPD